MTARGAAGRCPTTTWLLVSILVSSGIAKDLKRCDEMIGDGHLQLLQQLIDSQMETSCKISFMFVDQEKVKDQVCYIKKAFFLVQDILEDIISFKDNTSNANALSSIQELAVRLNVCFPKVDDQEQDKACVQNFSESPLWLLEKIKNVFSETKNLLKDKQNIFSKDCNNSFAECSSQGPEPPPKPQHHEPLIRPLASGGGVILVLLALGGLLFYGWRCRSRRRWEPQTVHSLMERPEGSPLTQDEDRQVDVPV
ncbi:macrophage colony-stimulating factor 1 isoform X3 [Phyllostomus hastatus]|uniref:macrophage colony-stimulating factor 1 isoform X3 n=1 Tax=Phyllostomus hastatus TaxID=9423 RepID=UPI001E6846BE|nr:macrophage colony-stimulating factor 1 isoform X3 [Phyllostomus hastatus]